LKPLLSSESQASQLEGSLQALSMPVGSRFASSALRFRSVQLVGGGVAAAVQEMILHDLGRAAEDFSISAQSLCM